VRRLTEWKCAGRTVHAWVKQQEGFPCKAWQAYTPDPRTGQMIRRLL
jgi:hypothetical protein